MRLLFAAICIARLIASALAQCTLAEVAAARGSSSIAVIAASNPPCGACLTYCLAAADQGMCTAGCDSADIWVRMGDFLRILMAATGTFLALGEGQCTMYELVSVSSAGNTGPRAIIAHIAELSMSSPPCGACLSRCVAIAIKDDGKCAACCLLSIADGTTCGTTKRQRQHARTTAHTPIHPPAHTHTHTHARTHPPTHPRTHTRTHTHTHSPADARIRTCTHARLTHAHSCTHT